MRRPLQVAASLLFFPSDSRLKRILPLDSPQPRPSESACRWVERGTASWKK